MIAILFAVLFLFLFLGFPVFLSIGFSTIAYFLEVREARVLLIFTQRLFTGLYGYSFLAVPMFVLAGNAMTRSGVTDRLLKFAGSLIGHVRGGLAQVNIVGSIFFAGISGSAIADTAAIGAVLIPAMEKEGYEKGFAGAITAASSTIGPVIPPSIVMVVYGAAFNVSIALLFAAAFIPGLLIGISQMVITYVIAVKRGYPVSKRSSLKNVVRSFFPALVPLFMPVIIIGGMFSGIFTATEASVVAAVYALFLGLFVFKTLRFSDLFSLFTDTLLTSAGILMIIASAQAFSWVLARNLIPQQIASVVLNYADNPVIFLLLINVCLIVAGMFIGRTINLFLLGPILIPIMIDTLGLSAIHTAMIIVFGLGIGHLTPPLGMALYATAMVGKMDVEEILKYMPPYILGMVALTLLITFVPAIVRLLPSILGML